MDSAELAVMEFGRVAVVSKEAQGMCTSILAAPYGYAIRALPLSPLTSVQAYKLHMSSMSNVACAD